MEEKNWYKSKLFWLGVLITLQGIVPLISEFLQKQDFSPLAVGSVISGLLVIVLRVWFTDTPISR